MEQSLKNKIVYYNKTRPFSGFLTETESGFLLLERFINTLLNCVLTDNDLFHHAMLSFKNFESDETFDKEWVDIIEITSKKFNLNLDNQQMVKAFKVLPMEFYNYSKDHGDL